MFKHFATDTGKGNWTVIAGITTAVLLVKWGTSADFQSSG